MKDGQHQYLADIIKWPKELVSEKLRQCFMANACNKEGIPDEKFFLMIARRMSDVLIEHATSEVSQ